jgi:hypothetical protein
MSLQTQNLTLSEELERFYSEKFYFSYSSINKLLFSPRLFYSHYILNQKEDSTDAHLIAGRALHCLLLEPEKFDELFVTLPGKIPTDSNKIIIDHVFNNHYLPMNNDALTLDDFPNELLGQMVVNNLYQSLKTDVQRLEKLLTSNNKEYFDFLKIKQTKTVIDPAVKQQAEQALEAIKANDRVTALLQLETERPEGVSVYNELFLTTDLEKYPFGFKGFIDNVVVDENTKRLFINDLKTTNKSIQDFPESVAYYRYDIQATMYVGLAYEKFLKDRPDANEWTIVFTFIVIDKYNQVYPFQVSKETLANWEEEFSFVVIQLDYHYLNRDYTLPYQLAIGNVIL